MSVVDDEQVKRLLRQLRSRDPHEAWSRFLELYSPLLLDVVRLFEREEDAIADCYLFLCEQLCRDNFRRLRRFKQNGLARFSTWLTVVTRNLCLDWHRQQVGRERAFQSIGRLGALDQSVFQALFVKLVPADDMFLEVKESFPGLTLAQAAAAVDRVERTLTPRQRWLLMVRRNRTLAAAGAPGRPGDEELLRIPSELPNPETWTGLQEERAKLFRAMTRLSPRQRLLIQLRFGRDLTLDEIARLLNLGSAQSADRHIRDAVEKLRRIVSAGSGKPSPPSV